MKKLLSFMTAAVLCLSAAMTVSANGFSDTAGHWAQDEIELVSSIGLFQGDGDGTFRPEDDITRAEFLKILSVIMGYADGKGDGSGMTHWIAPYNDYALHSFLDPDAETPVSNSDGTVVHPGELLDENADFPIERWEMAYMIWQSVDNYLMTQTDLSVGFRDTEEIAQRYPQSIQIILANVSSPDLYLFNGDEENRFNASEHATRAEAAALSVRVLELFGFLNSVMTPINTSRYGSDVQYTTSAEVRERAESKNENTNNQKKENQEMAEHSFATVTMENGGVFKIELMPEYAPETVANFIELAEDGFYDGLTFHRVVDGFMAQGGDPNGNGTGGSAKTVKGEFASNGFTQNTLSHTRGVISMARSQNPDSASSQFFICYDDASFLDGQYAAFGKVIEGMDVVDGFLEVERSANAMGEIAAPVTPIRIKSITISNE